MALKNTYAWKIMPSGSVTDMGWLNAQVTGSVGTGASWTLLQVIPLSPIIPGSDGVTPQGNILCYFVSSST